MLYYDGFNEDEVFGNYDYQRLPSWVWKAVKKNHNIVEIHKIEQKDGFIIVRGKEVDRSCLNWVLDYVSVRDWSLTLKGLKGNEKYVDALFPEDEIDEVRVWNIIDHFKCLNLIKESCNEEKRRLVYTSFDALCQMFGIDFKFPEGAKSIRTQEKTSETINHLQYKEETPIIIETIEGPAWIKEQYTTTPLVYNPCYKAKRKYIGEPKKYKALKSEFIKYYSEGSGGHDGWRPKEFNRTICYKQYKVDYEDGSSAIVSEEV